MTKDRRRPIRICMIERYAPASSVSWAKVVLSERSSQVGEQVAKHHAGLRRIGLREELHRRQRVEEKMRLDLRLHQLQLRLDRLLREQVAFRLGFEHRRTR